MKFVDKHGNEIDCTVDEYRELVGLEVKKEEPKKVIVVKQTKKEHKKRKGGYDWDILSEKACSILKQGKAKNIKHLLTMIGTSGGGSNIRQLESALKRNFGINLNLIRGQKRRSKKGYSVTAEKNRKNGVYDNHKNRMKFIQSRLRVLMKENKGLKYDEAFRRASFEYQNKTSTTPKPKPVIEEYMPHFRTLNEKGNSLIEGVVKSVIANRGQMSYLLDGKMLGLGSGTQWRNFCEEFKTLSKQISDYFGVKDCFCFMRIDDKFDVIRYKYQ